MTGPILILIISSILLALTGSLPPAAATALVVGGGAALFISNFRRHQDKHRLLLRGHELGATSALSVRHLGGLPFPVPTPVSLFLTPAYVRIESDYDLWQCSRSQLDKLVLISAEQLRRLPDREIIKALAGGNSRLLSLVRERIRRGGAQTRRAWLLFMAIRSQETEDADPEVVILSFSDRRSMQKLLQREGLSSLVVDFLQGEAA